MSDPKHSNYTGYMWELLDVNGTSGLGDTTSLCHAWSSEPTADLSRYVLGAQPVSYRLASGIVHSYCFAMALRS